MTRVTPMSKPRIEEFVRNILQDVESDALDIEEAAKEITKAWLYDVNVNVSEEIRSYNANLWEGY